MTDFKKSPDIVALEVEAYNRMVAEAGKAFGRTAYDTVLVAAPISLKDALAKNDAKPVLVPPTPACGF